MDVLEKPSLTRTPYTPNKKDVGVQTSIPTDVKLFISVATKTDNNILITNKKTCGTKSNNQTSSELNCRSLKYVEDHSYTAAPPKDLPPTEPSPVGPVEKQNSDSDSDDEYAMYSPSSSSEDIESEDANANANAAEEKKYIVFENELQIFPTVWKHICDQNKTS